MSDKLKTGAKGEEEAALLLRRKGFEILDRNWRFDHKEIDIVAKKQEIIVFVEVKTRHAKALHEAFDAVDLRKQKNLIDAAEAYLEEKNLDYEMRFDIVAVYHSQNQIVKIEHLEDAFYDEL